jgi:CRISPR-associated endonuclease/helicase Cas3
VCRAAESVYASVGEELAAALGVDGAVFASLRPLLRAAALLHDVAKVNSAFQAMLRAKPGDLRRQPVRHEILAGWLLTDPDFFGRWFAGLRREEEVWPVIWAIAGHHLKMGDPARGAALFNAGSGTAMVTVPLASDEVRQLFEDAAGALRATGPLPHLGDARFDTADDADEGLEQRVARFAEASCRAWDRLRRNAEALLRTALLKALLVAADVAGSALAADGKEAVEWVPRELAARITPEALGPVIHQGTKGNDPLDFQKEVGGSEKSATVVIAGCGNGKTTAAYLWAQRHAVGRKLWFTYPTTGTASAGYQGYLYDHPDLRSDLIHSRAEVDLQAMWGTAEEGRNDEPLRLESLRAWGQQAIVCTADTVLGLLQNQRRPLFSFPAIATGAFVFDEIHSYDGRLFGSLLRFLGTFPGVPVLLMSASIPPVRLAALRDVLGDRVGEVIRGDPAMEGYQRYRLEPRDSAAACQREVAATLRARKKVLWVCNTVADAVNVAREAREWAGVPPCHFIVYHSRFRYKDRVERQRELIARFRGDEPVLAVTTQVCEMSLDISADLMTTAECPLPALVQRLGRLHRYATGDDPWPCLVYPFQGEPYNEDPDRPGVNCQASMAAARAAVRELAGRPCSQCDLAQRLDRMAEAEQFETYSAWLDDGWVTEPGAVRDGDTTVTLIREEDLSEIGRALGPEHAKPSQWTSRSLVPWTIPMLHRRDFRPARRAGGYPVAAAGTVAYTTEEGATWQKRTN